MVLYKGHQRLHLHDHVQGHNCGEDVTENVQRACLLLCLLSHCGREVNTETSGDAKTADGEEAPWVSRLLLRKPLLSSHTSVASAVATVHDRSGAHTHFPGVRVGLSPALTFASLSGPQRHFKYRSCPTVVRNSPPLSNCLFLSF